MFNNDFNKLESYIKAHTEPENELLKELERETHLKILRPRMLSGHIQGRVLAMLSKMIAPQNIFEIGTFTGYSAICLSEGLVPDGKLITCDVNDEIEDFTRGFIERSPHANNIEYIIADARKVLQDLNQTFDLVFIDGDKRQYQEYYKMVFPHVKAGGFIIIDNVLWGEKVLVDPADDDPYTAGVQGCNTLIQHDQRVENVIFPFRDGLMVLRKKPTN